MLALEPSDPEAHAIRGTWFRWRGEMDSAVAEARKSVELDPLGRQWPGRLARQLILARRYPEAEAIYRRMMRDDPRAWPSYMGLSDLYKTMGRMRDAIAMWRAADSVSGDSTDAARLPVAPSEAEAARWFTDQARRPARYAAAQCAGRRMGWGESVRIRLCRAFGTRARPCAGSTRCSYTGIPPSRPSRWIRTLISCATIRATRRGKRSCPGAGVGPGR